MLTGKQAKQLERDKKEYVRGFLLLALKFSEDKLIQNFYRLKKREAETNWNKIYEINYLKFQKIDSEKPLKKNIRSKKK